MPTPGLSHLERFKLPVTPGNEALLRGFLLERWIVRHARMRERHRRQGLSKKDSRFLRQEAALDLSGGCKVAAIMSLLVFDLQGRVISNPRHTFVLTTKGDIFDLNRNCRDVQKMLERGRDPYEMDPDYYDLPSTLESLATWEWRVKHWHKEFKDVLTTLDLGEFG